MRILNIKLEVEDDTKDILKEVAAKQDRSMTKEIQRILNTCAKYRLSAEDIERLSEEDKYRLSTEDIVKLSQSSQLSPSLDEYYKKIIKNL